MKKIIVILLCVLLCGCFGNDEVKDDDDKIVDLNTMEIFILTFNATDNSHSNENVSWYFQAIDMEHCGRHIPFFRINRYTWFYGNWMEEMIYSDSSCSSKGETELKYEDTPIVYEFQWQGIVTITYELNLIKD